MAFLDDLCDACLFNFSRKFLKFLNRFLCLVLNWLPLADFDELLLLDICRIQQYFRRYCNIKNVYLNYLWNAKNMKVLIANMLHNLAPFTKIYRFTDFLIIYNYRTKDQS